MFQNRYKDIRTALNNRARDVIKTMRFRWSQMFEGFQNSEPEKGAEDKNPEYNKRERKTTGQG
jgi:hypothetical protein